MRNKTPLFSIIVPIFNAEKTIGKLLDSILIQDLTDYEIILIDDCSSDNSIKEITKIITKNNSKEITLLNNPANRGVSFSRNRGVKAARGTYILFADADDYYLNETILQELHDAITNAQNPSVILFGFVKEYIGLRGRKSRKSRYPIKRWQASRNYQLTVFPQRYIWNLTARRELILSNKITFDENVSMNEDAIWRSELMWCASDIAVLEENLYCYVRTTATGESYTTDNEIPFSERLSGIVKTVRGIEAARRKWHGPKLIVWPLIALIIIVQPVGFATLYVFGFFRDRMLFMHYR